MNITFLGTGEACDPARANTSILIEKGNSLHLLDCGFTTVQRFMSQAPQGKPLDSLWLSHFHGDHFFGLPQLILHLHQQGRTSPLTILSGANAKDKVEQCTEMAYAGLLDKLSYPLAYLTVPCNSTIEHGGLCWQAAPVIHSKEPFGLLVHNGSKRLYYSGDGKPTDEARQLMEGCDLVIHEAYTLTDILPTHCSVEECTQLMDQSNFKQLALVHLSAKTAGEIETISKRLQQKDINNIIIAEQGKTIRL